MKPIHRSSFRGSIGAVVTSSAVLLLAFAFATSQVHAQTGNTATGNQALDSNTTGDWNTADGYRALTANTTGSYNTAVGADALFSNVSGSSNTADGAFALTNNRGSYNTANGAGALFVNNTGSYNTANGNSALASNISGNFNTATGNGALGFNTASYNTADGNEALFGNSTGIANTANGYRALYSNSTGYSNTADGVEALWNNNGGVRNTASGDRALFSNTEGSFNTANGFRALYNNTASGNTADGYQALYSNTTGSNNIGLGTNAGRNLTNGSGNVCIGVNVVGVAGESNTTRIRNVYSSVASGRAVYVNLDNKIGTLASSRRFKDEIKPMDKVSEAILELKPVTFHYKKEIEPNGTIMFGLIAEEVEKVAPELVTRNDKGEVETVRYEAVNAMLLNEFLKEHRRVEEQGCKMGALETRIARQQKEFRTTVEQQQKEITALTAALKAQAAQIQNISEQVRTAKPAARLASNQE